ncbi:hypothetical protein [Agrobacterium tumefaciens]|uniref:hypothetical protein n=1 Tax=Agrobacterium tumefaciens TaxID=358 RepID=UPI0021D38D97|nr:hypothetical protein [Agrobacterium tumefaciens]UXS08701.1 hypothetical protein FY155_03430 [Agrobacterium tumefaciens]UXS16061.1 hypothetical protein FY154_03425 [Agrobacterium tumefaciens]
MNIANDFHALANRLARLAPSHWDPFRFHEEKSELVHELHMLANAVADALGRIEANDNTAGFAPGGYMCKCSDCGKRFTGDSALGGARSVTSNHFQQGSGSEIPNN